MPLVPAGIVVALACALFLSATGTAQAYVGPGLGAGAIGAVLGIVGAVLLALFSLIYYPIKRVLGRRKSVATAGTAKRP